MSKGWRRRRDSRPQPGEQSPEGRRPVALGREYAAALAAEKAQRERHPDVRSPLGITYDFWAGETDLVRFCHSGADDRVRSLVQDGLGQDADEREILRSSLTIDDLYTLLTYAGRMAVHALRTKDPVRAIDGLTAQ